MMKRMDKREAGKKCIALVADTLFCIVHEPLKKLVPDFTELHPVEIWIEAQNFSEMLQECPAPEELMEEFMETLKDEVEKPDDIFLVLMVSICQLSAFRTEKADKCIKLIMPYCRPHKMYYPLLERFDGKEQRLKAESGRKVDIMNYAFMELDGDIRQVREAFGRFLATASTLTPDSIVSNLLAFNLFNLQNGHIFDNEILEIYKALVKKSDPGNKFELIFGNKNESKDGGVQLNLDTLSKLQPEQIAETVQQLKLLQ